MAPALMSFDAELTTTGPEGSRRIPLEDFYVRPAEDPTRDTVLTPGEIVIEILLPPPAKGQHSRYGKIRARRSWHFAVAGCALALTMEREILRDSRVVLSAAAPFPWRSREAEQALNGKRLEREVIAKAAAAAVAKAKPMSMNGYKIALFRGLIEEELAKVVRVAR